MHIWHLIDKTAIIDYGQWLVLSTSGATNTLFEDATCVWTCDMCSDLTSWAVFWVCKSCKFQTMKTCVFSHLVIQLIAMNKAGWEDTSEKPNVATINFFATPTAWWWSGGLLGGASSKYPQKTRGLWFSSIHWQWWLEGWPYFPHMQTWMLQQRQRVKTEALGGNTGDTG